MVCTVFDGVKIDPSHIGMTDEELIGISNSIMTYINPEDIVHISSTHDYYSLCKDSMVLTVGLDTISSRVFNQIRDAVVKLSKYNIMWNITSPKRNTYIFKFWKEED